MRTMTVTLLGTGSSSGVPKPGGDWGQCDPGEPRNRRRRCSALVEVALGPDAPSEERTTVLIDTAPDLREQLLDAGTRRIDAVLYTHDHADQTHGIDDLRHIAGRMRKRIKTYADEVTTGSLTSRFGYCFRSPEGSPYPPILDHALIEPLTPVAIDGPGGPLTALPFDQDHGTIRSLGFRIGPVAYSADVVDLPDESFAALDGLECWVCDALRFTPHMTHAHVDKTLAWFERVGVPYGVLTNLHIDLDYRTLCDYVPEPVTVGYDGLQLVFEVA